jgi:hypothetical protein
MWRKFVERYLCLLSNYGSSNISSSNSSVIIIIIIIITIIIITICIAKYTCIRNPVCTLHIRIFLHLLLCTLNMA